MKKKTIMAGLLLAAAFTVSCGPSDKDIASMASVNVLIWQKRQQAYVVENGKVGSNKDIGWGGYSDEAKLNNSCKEKDCFSFYSSHIPGTPAVPDFLGLGLGQPAKVGYASFWAELNEDLGKCKAGNKWYVRVTDDEIVVMGDLDKSCQELTPNFLKGKSEYEKN
jgi:hypothetical protein